jgi:hypothetical protein
LLASVQIASYNSHSASFGPSAGSKITHLDETNKAEAREVPLVKQPRGLLKEQHARRQPGREYVWVCDL